MGLAADVSYVGIDLFWHNFALPFPDMGTLAADLQYDLVET